MGNNNDKNLQQQNKMKKRKTITTTNNFTQLLKKLDNYLKLLGSAAGYAIRK